MATSSLWLLALLANVRAFQIKPIGARTAAPSHTSHARVEPRGPPGTLGRGGISIRSTSSRVASSTHASESESRERRSFLRNVARSALLSPVVLGSAGANAAAEAGPPKVTHTVFMDVRISRADGSFYVRDAAPTGSPNDEPIYAHLVFGLFGDEAPNHVQQFLNYVDVRYDVDNPLPSFSRSKFGTLDSNTGLLIGGTIPGLTLSQVAGGNALEYAGRITPAKLWMEDGNAPPRLSHDSKGLLTHRNLDVTPSFGITTRSKTTSLDATHTIFGRVLEDKGAFLDCVVDLPVLTDEGRVSKTTNEPVAAGGSVAASVFNAQRTIFRDAAKTFGDSRLDKVYDGKLLRRIEVTKVGVL